MKNTNLMKEKVIQIGRRCIRCLAKIIQGEDYLQCNGICALYYHAKCVKDSIADTTQIYSQEKGAWKCRSCNQQTKEATDVLLKVSPPAQKVDLCLDNEKKNCPLKAEVEDMTVANSSSEKNRKCMTEVADNHLSNEQLEIVSVLDTSDTPDIEETISEINMSLSTIKTALDITKMPLSLVITKENHKLLSEMLNILKGIIRKTTSEGQNKRQNQNQQKQKIASKKSHKISEPDKVKSTLNSAFQRKLLSKEKRNQFSTQVSSSNHKTQDVPMKEAAKIELKSAKCPKPQYSRIYVSRLHPETSPYEIEHVLSNRYGYEVKAYKIKDFNRNYGAFCVSVSTENYDELLKPMYWPLGAVVTNVLWKNEKSKISKNDGKSKSSDNQQTTSVLRHNETN